MHQNRICYAKLISVISIGCWAPIDRILGPARWIHSAGAKQHISLSQRLLDRRDRLEATPAGLDVVAGANERSVNA